MDNWLNTQKSPVGASAENEIEYDLQMAESIIHKLIPKNLNIHDLNIAIRYEMAKHVGGDLTYVYPVDSSKTVLTICDVVGHGVVSALIVVYIHSHVQRIIQNNPSSLFDFINQLNTVIYDTLKGLSLFFTYAVMLYDHTDSSYRLATCGHPPILIRKSDNRLISYTTPYPVLGLFPSLQPEPEEKVHHLERGDKIIFYTDGIPEAYKDSLSDFFGKKRFLNLLLHNRHLSNGELAELILNKVKDFSGQEIKDDLSLMIISKNTESTGEKAQQGAIEKSNV